MRGGTDTTGFGDILGNALALLYVSRQGLREGELWAMLSLLQFKAERDTTLTQATKEANHMVVRQVAEAFSRHKGQLTDMFKAEDVTRTGYIPRRQVLRCVRQVAPRTSRAELLQLLEFVDLHTPPALPVAGLVHYFQDRDLLIGDRVHYPKLFVLLGKMGKLIRGPGGKAGPGVGTGVGVGSRPGTGAGLGMGRSKSSRGPREAGKGMVGVGGMGGGGGGRGGRGLAVVDDDDYDCFQLTAVTEDRERGEREREGYGDRESNGDLDPFFQEEGVYPPLARASTAPAGLPSPQSKAGRTRPTRARPTGVGTGAGADADTEEEEANYSLGPVIEESLLQILSALGVLHDSENKVLILPSDSEPFRNVIYSSYILRGGEMHWHQLIINHFQTQPNSMRKCEELPWHLKICRRWYALRDTLVDLQAFALMARTDLKDELALYWLLLTEGPLPLPESSRGAEGQGQTQGPGQSQGPGQGQCQGQGQGAQAQGKKEQEKNHESSYSHLLREIDHATEHRVTVRDARRRLVKNQLPPFDVVEEFNRALEGWVIAEKPTPAKIHRMIMDIGRFLFDFSGQSHHSPDFLRLGIDLEAVSLFAGALSGGDMHVARTEMEGEEGGSRRGSVERASPSDRGRGGGGEGREGREGKKEKEYFGDTAKVENAKFPTQALLDSKLYLYLRWVWVQFPWVAMHSSAGVAAQMHETRMMIMNVTGMEKHHTGAGADGAGPGVGGHEPFDALHSLDSCLEDPSHISNADSERLLRVWNVRKCDPTVPVFIKSESRRLAAIKPRSSLSSGLERNVEVTYDKLYEEITSPSHIAKIQLGYKNKDKYRRPFDEEVQMGESANIPFAYHSVRAMKHHTLFPSYEKSLADLNLKRRREQEEEPSRSRRVLKRFDVEQALQQRAHKDPKDGKGNPFMLVELDDEIQRMNNDDYMAKHKVDRIGGSVIKDETDLEYEASLDRVSRMKTVCNKLTIIQREKTRLIGSLGTQLMIRRETDQLLVDEVVASEGLLRHLHERNRVVEREMEEARKIEDGYEELLLVLKKNPPFVESHVKSLEIEVELAGKQFLGLCQHRVRLYQETEDSDLLLREPLQRIEYFGHARYAVAQKKRQVMREMRTSKGNKEVSLRRSRRGKRELGVEDSVNSEDLSDSESEKEEEEVEISVAAMHFLNAIARKNTFNETIIKVGDKHYADVKRRYDEAEANQRAPSKENRNIHRLGIPTEVPFEDLPAEVPVEEGSLESETSPSPKSKRQGGLGGGQGRELGQGLGGGQVRRRSLLKGHGAGGMGVQAWGQESLSPPAQGHANHGQTTPRGLGQQPGVGSLSQRSCSEKSGITVSGSPSSGLGGGAHGVQFKDLKRRLTGEEMARLKEGLGVFMPVQLPSVYDIPATINVQKAVPPSGTGGKGKGAGAGVAAVEVGLTPEQLEDIYKSRVRDAFRAQVQRAHALLLEKTESASVEGFLERYHQCQSVLEGLRKQQGLSESRLAQLTLEHAELFSACSDLAFLSEDVGRAGVGGDKGQGEDEQGGSSKRPAPTVTSPRLISPSRAAAGTVDRYPDNELFTREVRMNKQLRKAERAEQVVGEVRNAMASLTHLLAINSRLLHALPKSEPPPLESDQDIPAAVMWVEDRIMALSEALTMDANRPMDTDANKPLSERQLDLALLVQKMNAAHDAAHDPPTRLSHVSQKHVKSKGRSNMSFSLLNEPEDAPFVSIQGVMVPPVGRVDKIFDSMMSKLIAEREKQADLAETSQQNTRDSDSHSSLVQTFLAEGLDVKQTRDLSRRANLLLNKRKGRAASFGLVLENLLAAKGQTLRMPGKGSEPDQGASSMGSTGGEGAGLGGGSLHHASETTPEHHSHGHSPK